MQQVEVTSRIVGLIAENFATESSEIQGDSKLIEDGIIDSMGVMNLIGLLESEFSVTFDEDDFMSDDFMVPATLSKLICQKRSD